MKNEQNEKKNNSPKPFTTAFTSVDQQESSEFVTSDEDQQQWQKKAHQNNNAWNVYIYLLYILRERNQDSQKSDFFL